MIPAGVTPLDRPQMAARLARDIPEGWFVNLGVGVPTQVADHIPADREVIIHSENGILGMGPAPAPDAVDPWLVNAGKKAVTLLKGAALFHHADSFAMIRGGHIDLCVLGAFEVAANGDLANWTTSSNDKTPAVGGAMDLAVGAKRIWILMEHVTRDGKPRLVEHCSYPLTAPGAVTRVYTNLAVLDVTPSGFAVVEMVPGLTLDALQALTAAPLVMASS
ncbi:3-oxoacid CoA-transferase subunit B [uncultured Sphingomonas sp.]|jgi:3-oxoadipate CoA-transferase beta subunit|uniref:3-oxoacid CoA-transferase subunit B n=1 Tax=uncultured Sphingomonas sp. TaxID=158754 RepID=UPI002627E511|nr:3-oxoacid CoA-transferase subunit B [uncultured Sphingomonas sp.]